MSALAWQLSTTGHAYKLIQSALKRIKHNTALVVFVIETQINYNLG